MHDIDILYSLLNIEELFTFAFLFNIFSIARNRFLYLSKAYTKRQELQENKINVIALLISLFIMFILGSVRLYIIIGLYALGQERLMFMIISIIEFFILLILFVLLLVLRYLYVKNNRMLNSNCYKLITIVSNIVLFEAMLSSLRLLIF